MRALKAALVALLVGNMIYLAVAETPSKAVDQAAWLTLLALFMTETAFGGAMRRSWARLAVRALRLIAAAGVLGAMVAYMFEENALDGTNAVLWILVVVLLEVELRWPALPAKNPRAFKIAAAALFGGLGLLVLIWASRGQWFDAYDAVLWLLAFAAIELEIARRRETQAATARARGV